MMAVLALFALVVLVALLHNRAALILWASLSEERQNEEK